MTNMFHKLLNEVVETLCRVIWNTLRDIKILGTASVLKLRGDCVCYCLIGRISRESDRNGWDSVGVFEKA